MRSQELRCCGEECEIGGEGSLEDRQRLPELGQAGRGKPRQLQGRKGKLCVCCRGCCSEWLCPSSHRLES